MVHSPRSGDDDYPAVKRDTVVDRTVHSRRGNVLPACSVEQETLDIAPPSVAGRCSAGKRVRPMFIVSFAPSTQHFKLLLEVAGCCDMLLDQIARRDSLALDSAVHLVVEGIGCCSMGRSCCWMFALVPSGQVR